MDQPFGIFQRGFGGFLRRFRCFPAAPFFLQALDRAVQRFPRLIQFLAQRQDELPQVIVFRPDPRGGLTFPPLSFQCFVPCQFGMTDFGLQVACQRLAFLQRPLGFIPSDGFGCQCGFVRCSRLLVGAGILAPAPRCDVCSWPPSRRSTVTGTSPSCTKRRRCSPPPNPPRLPPPLERIWDSCRSGSGRWCRGASPSRPSALRICDLASSIRLISSGDPALSWESSGS